MTWLVSGTALLLSIGACIVAVLSWRRSLSTSAERLSRRLTDLESIAEEHSADMKKIRQAQYQAAYRKRLAAEATSTPEAADEDERARVRRLLTLKANQRGIP